MEQHQDHTVAKVVPLALPLPEIIYVGEDVICRHNQSGTIFWEVVVLTVRDHHRWALVYPGWISGLKEHCVVEDLQASALLFPKNQEVDPNEVIEDLIRKVNILPLVRFPEASGIALTNVVVMEAEPSTQMVVAPELNDGI